MSAYNLANLDETDGTVCLSFAARLDVLEAQEELVSLARGKDNLAEKPGKNNWIEKTSDVGLPEYIAHVAKGLIDHQGMEKSRAIATAISMCKRWAAGGKDVKPDTRAKAAAAVAEWEKLKASNSARKAAK